MGDEPTMMVRAVRIGFYGGSRRYPAGMKHPTAGQPFRIKVSEFSDSSRKPEANRPPGWMEAVGPVAPVQRAPAAPAPLALVESVTVPAQSATVTLPPLPALTITEGAAPAPVAEPAATKKKMGRPRKVPV